jgi:hypothetical protein
MDPATPVCHPLDGPDRGQAGRGNLRGHSRGEQRYRCRPWGRTFAATTATPFYRWRTAADVVTRVLTRLGHGGPWQAIVAAFGFAERTVAAGPARAGQHGQGVHGALVPQGQVELEPVQADELGVKRVAQRVGLARAMAAPSRRWLGAVISAQRDGHRITALAEPVRAGAKRWAFLLCVDGVASDVTAFQKVFPHPLRTGRAGRPRLEVAPDLLLAQGVKR